MMEFAKYSVLMSVYKNDRPEYLVESIDSILSQTVPPDDFVIVCDGPIPESLNKIILDFQASNHCINVVRLSENVGLGKALSAGMKHCKNELIARMDSDDVSSLDRMEKQLGYFEQHNVDVVGGSIAEFYEDPKNPLFVRRVPLDQPDIVEFLKYRNPMNHVSVMFRKSAVCKVGGYQDMPFLEDYYLWARMIYGGMNLMNVEEILVFVRTGAEMYKRRSGLEICRSQIKMAKELKRMSLITSPEFLKNVVIRVGGSIVPNSIRQFVYEKKLRTSI